MAGSCLRGARCGAGIAMLGLYQHYMAAGGLPATPLARTQLPHEPPAAALVTYSTVTDFARLRGWSTSVPMITAVW